MKKRTLSDKSPSLESGSCDPDAEEIMISFCDLASPRGRCKARQKISYWTEASPFLYSSLS